MGSLRFLLAISVVLVHSGSFFGYLIVDGFAAVEIFFIISGFYMTMILNKKYIGEGSYYLFFTNRLLRLFPIYFTVLLLTLFFYVGGGILFDKWGSLSPYIEYFDLYNIQTLLYLIITNIVLFGQDVVMFMGIEISSGALFFTSNFRDTDPMLYEFLLVPQAWSIGVELLFYTIASFIVRKRPVVIIIFIVLSLMLRAFIYLFLGWTDDPWTYRFFPTELALFLFGTLSFHFYEYLNTHKKLVIFQKPIVSIYLVLLVGYQFISLDIPYFFHFKNWFIYLFSIVAIPYLFQATKTLKVDNFIGELSYPIYLIHMLIVTELTYLHIGSNKGILTVIISVLVSVVLVKYIDVPIERFRQSRVNKQN